MEIVLLYELTSVCLGGESFSGPWLCGKKKTSAGVAGWLLLGTTLDEVVAIAKNVSLSASSSYNLQFWATMCCTKASWMDDWIEVGCDMLTGSHCR